MTLQAATASADRYARNSGETFYVVWETDGYGGGAYDVCNDFDLETYYAGLEPVYAAG